MRLMRRFGHRLEGPDPSLWTPKLANWMRMIGSIPPSPALSGPTVLHRWPWGYISPKTFHAWTVRGEQGEEKRMLNLRQLIRKFGIVPLVVTLLSFPAAAQRVELFGGYQFTHLQPAFNANGWDASITGNFKHILGITGDFSGAYERGVHAY